MGIIALASENAGVRNLEEVNFNFELFYQDEKNDETVKPSCPNFSPKLKTKNYLAAAAVVRTSYMFKHTPYNALDVDVLMHSLHFITV